nr:MAG TPA: hypothetical protein [Caudoviricetes sp.]
MTVVPFPGCCSLLTWLILSAAGPTVKAALKPGERFLCG